MSNEIVDFNIREVLDGSDQYQIPIYQRNYAWGQKEIEALVQDITDSIVRNPNKNYYIGTLVVAEVIRNERSYYQIIDGQQRLTTLSILLAVLKKDGQLNDLSWYEKPNLHFESRKRSSSTFNSIISDSTLVVEEDSFEPNMVAAFEICKKMLQIKVDANPISINDFKKFFLEKVIIIRVPLSKGTDLNHYFEIMNSRGEQLEKHEIVKARLMKCFNVLERETRKKYENCFHLIWEACSNMEEYVQYGFTTEERHLIFGDKDWNILSVFSFDEIVEKIAKPLTDELSSEMMSLNHILQGRVKPESSSRNETEPPDHFNSVVNFQNFLLHVLKITKNKHDVVLDDKRLIDFFDQALEGTEEERLSFVKEFIYNLLKCKFLFDKYVIKREFTDGGDAWSLKSMKWYSSGQVKNSANYKRTFGSDGNNIKYSDNRKVIMLLSMFHVSNPSMSYKYWLNATLVYLFHQFEIKSDHYILYLEHIAKSFVFDRYLVEAEKDYEEIIYQNLKPIKRDEGNLDLNLLRYGSIKNNLVFNFLDYLLWLKYENEVIDQRVKEFKYTFRSSVEHYYPQNPISDELAKIGEDYLHSFGNLCLISHEKNSRYGNYPPKAKKSQYSEKAAIDSIKQLLMMSVELWDIKAIEDHGNEMILLLKENMDSVYEENIGDSLASKLFRKYQRIDPITLIRTLLCFGDCFKHLRWDKYNFKDFDYIKEHGAYQAFEEYIDEHEEEVSDLNDIIAAKLKEESFAESFYYLFVEYPVALSYCELGNVLLYDYGNQIQLLQSHKNTMYKSKDIYCCILQHLLNEELDASLYCDKNGLYFPIFFDDTSYKLAKENEDISMEIVIFNKGESIHHFMEIKVHWNSKEVKQLNDYGWIRNEENRFEYKGKSKLINLRSNYKENVNRSERKVMRLLNSLFEK